MNQHETIRSQERLSIPIPKSLVAAVVLGVAVIVLLLSCGCVASAQKPLKLKVGDTDFTRSCTFIFKVRDARYLSNGDILVSRAYVVNVVASAEGTDGVAGVVGSLPPTPKGTPQLDLSSRKLIVTKFDSSKCKVVSGGATQCYNITISSQAILSQM